MWARRTKHNTARRRETSQSTAKREKERQATSKSKIEGRRIERRLQEGGGCHGRKCQHPFLGANVPAAVPENRWRTSSSPPPWLLFPLPDPASSCSDPNRLLMHPQESSVNRRRWLSLQSPILFPLLRTVLRQDEESVDIFGPEVWFLRTMTLSWQHKQLIIATPCFDFFSRCIFSRFIYFFFSVCWQLPPVRC